MHVPSLLGGTKQTAQVYITHRSNYSQVHQGVLWSGDIFCPAWEAEVGELVGVQNAL